MYRFSARNLAEESQHGSVQQPNKYIENNQRKQNYRDSLVAAIVSQPTSACRPQLGSKFGSPKTSERLDKRTSKLGDEEGHIVM